jgi:hypothetical protein
MDLSVRVLTLCPGIDVKLKERKKDHFVIRDSLTFLLLTALDWYKNRREQNIGESPSVKYH